MRRPVPRTAGSHDTGGAPGKNGRGGTAKSVLPQREQVQAGSGSMKSKPKNAKRASRVKSRGRPQLASDPSERDVKDFMVATIEASLTETLEQIGFSKLQVKRLLAGSTNEFTAAVREKLRSRNVKK